MDRQEFKFASEAIDAKTGEFGGYGAIFGNIDSHGDVIQPGAFRETLADWERRGALPAMKLMHGTAANPFSGSDLPIGRWTEMREDAKGLYVKGKLSGMETDRGRYIYSLMEDGALNALSIGYRAIKAVRSAMPNVKRQLETVRLVEVSLLPAGSNPDAVVTDLKSGDGLTVRHAEKALRDAGFSATESKAILAKGYSAIGHREGDDCDPRLLKDAVSRAVAALSPR